MHSQRVNDPPLKQWIIITGSWEVSCAHCTCMAGIAESCTHVGALLFAIVNLPQTRGKDCDSTMQLKQGHRYYAQVQTQIFVTGSSYCDFVVWTLKDLVVVRVVPDVGTGIFPQGFPPWAHLPVLLYTRDPSTPQRTRVFTVKSKNSKAATAPAPKQQWKTVRNPKSARNETNKEYVWCVYRVPEELDTMVCCDNSSCTTQWFHLTCVGLDAATAEEKAWYCDACL